MSDYFISQRDSSHALSTAKFKIEAGTRNVMIAFRLAIFYINLQNFANESFVLFMLAVKNVLQNL